MLIQLVQVFLVVVGTFLAYFVVHALRILYGNLTSPLCRVLNGPPIANYLLGNFKEVEVSPSHFVLSKAGTAHSALLQDDLGLIAEWE
uniref:Cytochrome P450 n=1 Tax=Mycena chlorophos TaxID=658473 RepID=A0ABQ0LR69_MYCCL|nr:predicted protein [Mycena chlorophos]